MLRFLLSVCLACITLPGMAQASFRLLGPKDPLVGEWEWIKTDTSAMFSPFTGHEWMYLSFSAGTTQSFGAQTFSEEKGYGATAHFLAFTDGGTLTATLSDSPDKGKKFTFTYYCDRNTLVITWHGEQFIYRRRSR